MPCNLDQDLYHRDLARQLRPGVKVDDPYARRYAYRRPVDARDDLRAADIVRAQRRALMDPRPTFVSDRPVPRPEPSHDDLVALMAEALVRAVRFDLLDIDDAHAVEVALITAGFTPRDAGRADLVTPAAARAHAQLRRRALLDHAADGAAFGTLLLAWTAGYCLLCPPAHAATDTPFLTDARLFSFFTWAPLVFAVLLGLVFCWRERDKPWSVDDEEPEPAYAPPTVPDLASLEARLRAADQG